MPDITYLQAVVIGLLQGVTELFPISSLGHSVLRARLDRWRLEQACHRGLDQEPGAVALPRLHRRPARRDRDHALLWFYRRDWVEVISAFFRTLRTRKVETSTERLAWLIVVATVPVGITGLVLEHTFRTLFAKPGAAAAFLTLNGLVLLLGEWLRRRSVAQTETGTGDEVHGTRKIEALRGYPEAATIGLFQTFALLAGISRSGITMVGGLVRGLDHEDAAKFSFLLATPVILAAGVLKVPTLFGSADDHIHGQVISRRAHGRHRRLCERAVPTRYFATRTLTPFAVYCLVAGAASLIKFA